MVLFYRRKRKAKLICLLRRKTVTQMLQRIAGGKAEKINDKIHYEFIFQNGQNKFSYRPLFQ
jgi:hypothetical protein